MPRPILVPVDFSTVSKEALLFAAQLASCSSLPLVVLHIVHQDARQRNIYQRRNDREQILPIQDIAERTLEDFMIDMRKQHPDSTVLANSRVMSVSGLPATRIPEIACLIDAGLIVMGSNIRSSLSRLTAGSVSERVTRKSPVPVTIVHSNGTVHDYGKTGTRQSTG